MERAPDYGGIIGSSQKLHELGPGGAKVGEEIR